MKRLKDENAFLKPVSPSIATSNNHKNTPIFQYFQINLHFFALKLTLFWHDIFYPPSFTPFPPKQKNEYFLHMYSQFSKTCTFLA